MNSAAGGGPQGPIQGSLWGMTVLADPRDLTADELRHGIVSDLERMLPGVLPTQLEREVVIELERFDGVPVRQYLPVLVARTVRDHHR